MSPASDPSPPLAPRRWRFPGADWDFRRGPRIMGIVNVTPDSFSDGGRWLAVDAAIDHALRLVDDGADVLDIGGESTRPGAAPVDMDEECRRVLPVVERLAGRTSVPISIDTTKGEVARRALGAGARIVNDISGLAADPEMPGVCAAADCGVIAMHMQGTPQTMQLNPSYGDVVREVRDYLCGRLEVLTAAGISAERIVLDPGVGFGKTALHNLQLLRNLRSLHELGRPILIGHSRKRFLEKVLGRPLEERLAGTIGVAIAVAQQEAELIRVHDVRAVIDGLAAWRAIQGPDDGHPDEA